MKKVDLWKMEEKLLVEGKKKILNFNELENCDKKNWVSESSEFVEIGVKLEEILKTFDLFCRGDPLGPSNIKDIPLVSRNFNF